ncbi:ATP-dependent Clp protease proteolytic subunit-related protein 1, chloroplastic-like isoform X3 [Spinacia oleracea]|uniref:ATP-dependent Clp protease proteolytic subunit-related protein 1, chloroplastic-like isoform X3 n=1 Tax=Spinacia oleracea TaxID=3562 RepID=A0ABM3R6C4_SPIOL|nr:ATP-dependent Clp protease proteolytic subunit-related protein 1, chloroplastic-like isoform X3 [Spinacia oleracea]
MASFEMDDRKSNRDWTWIDWIWHFFTILGVVFLFDKGCLAMGNQSISSARNYLDNGGMWSARGMDDRGASKYSMSITMYRSGAKGYGRPRTAPPDLPSLIFDTRIVYLVMPVVL